MAASGSVSSSKRSEQRRNGRATEKALLAMTFGPPSSSRTGRSTRWSAASACRRPETRSFLAARQRLELVLELGELGAAGHQADELLLVDLALGVRPEGLAAVQDHEAVAGGVGVVRVVRDEDDAGAVLARAHDVPQNDPGSLHTERRRRLVEDQHPRAEVDR